MWDRLIKINLQSIAIQFTKICYTANTSDANKLLLLRIIWKVSFKIKTVEDFYIAVVITRWSGEGMSVNL